MTLHGREIVGVRGLRVRAEADQELRPVRIEHLRVEIAEGVPRLDHIVVDGLAACVDEDLRAAGSLAQRDSSLFLRRQRRIELDCAERVERSGDDDHSCAEGLARAGVNL